MIRVKILHIIEVLEVNYILFKDKIVHYLLQTVCIVIMSCLVDVRGIGTGGRLYVIGAHGEVGRHALNGRNNLNLLISFDAVVLGA